MRIKVDLERTSKNDELTINYSYKLAAVLFGALSIASKELATKIHETKKYKFYTFSQLHIPERQILDDRIKITGDKAYFYISSPDKNLIRAFVEGLLSQGQFELDRVSFEIAKLRVYEGPKFEKDRVRFSTLSPIVLRVISDERKTKRVRYLYVTDTIFYEQLKKNLIRRYTAFYGNAPEDETFEIKRILSFKPVSYLVKGIYHRGNKLVFEVYGSAELLSFAYDCGLGEKTAMGFGMLKLARKKKLKEVRQYARILDTKR